MSDANILVVDDEADIRSLLSEILIDEGYSVEVAADGGEARISYANSSPDMVLLDIWMPDVDGITLLKEWSDSAEHDCPVVIMSGHGNVETAIEATRLGAVDYIEKPLSLAQLLRTVDNALKQRDMPRPESKVSRAHALREPVGKSEVIQTLREQCEVLAQHRAPLLISGEAGTGRESCARYIYELGSDPEPLRMVSGASPTAADAERILTGTEGMLTGAGGGLLVTAAEQMAPEAQQLLQGVLRQGFWLDSSGREHPLSPRVIATVSPQALASGELDPALQDAIGALKLRIPALRDYRSDVPELLRHYVDELTDDEGLGFRHFSMAAQNRLRNYPWPGNVRELRRLVRQVLLAGGEEEVTLAEVETYFETAEPPAGALVKQDLLALPLREAREAFEREYLLRQLELCGGKVGKLAERVGMERTHLYRKLRSLDIDFRQVGSDKGE